jgi:hypothetical protein
MRTQSAEQPNDLRTEAAKSNSKDASNKACGSESETARTSEAVTGSREADYAHRKNVKRRPQAAREL